MTGNHKIRSLGIYTRFDSETLAMDGHKALSVFAGDRLPRIMDEVFSSRSTQGLVRRFDRVELDLGTISWDEFPDGIEDRLRQKLKAFLDDHPVLPEPVLSTGSSRQLSSGLAAEEAILHFLKTGILPWHGSFSNAGDMVASLGKRLGTGAAHFVNRLKDAPDMKIMVKRLTRQFPEAIIEKILETVVPGRGRLTREVIRRLDAFCAAGTGEQYSGKTGRDPGSGSDTFQEIKDQVWEHILLMTLGGRGIFPTSLKMELPQHTSLEARQEISRILRQLPGSNVMALAGTTPHHTGTWPIPPFFWAEKIQDVLQKSGSKSDGMADPDIPRIWEEVILHCFEFLTHDSPGTLETALKTSPVPVSGRQENIEEEQESHQIITDRFLDNRPGNRTLGDQGFSNTKGKPVRKSTVKEVVNRAESDNGDRVKAGSIPLKSAISKHGADRIMAAQPVEKIAGPSHENSRDGKVDSGLLDEAFPSTTDQKNEPTQRPELFQSGVGSHSFWAEKIQSALLKSGGKTPRVADSDSSLIKKEDILHGFEFLVGDIQVKLETALKTSPVQVSGRQEDSAGDWEPHQVITDSPSDKSPDKQIPGSQILSPAKGRSVRKSTCKEVDNGVGDSDNGGRITAGNNTLRSAVSKDGADRGMTVLPMEKIGGSSHGNSRGWNLDSGILDEAVPIPMVQKDEASESQALFQSGVGRSFVRSGETGYKIYLQWIQSLLDCLGAMADKDASSMPACLTGEALSVIGDMIFEAAVSMPQPEVFLAELSTMVAGQVTGGKVLSKEPGRVPVKALGGKFIYGVDSLAAKVHGGDRADEPESAFSRRFAGKDLDNLRTGTLWQIILSETWIRILTSGLSPGVFGPAGSSDNKASYLSVMDSVLSLSPEKREPFAIRVLFRFAERMQLPIMPLPDLSGPEAQSRAANEPKAVKTIFQAPDTDGDSDPALGPALNPSQTEHSLPDPGQGPKQDAGHDRLGTNHNVGNPLEKWSALLRNPVVQKNIKTTLNLEETWDVIQVILYWKIRETGLENVGEKFKSDACAQLRKSPGDKQDNGRDSLVDKLSLTLKSGPDPKGFLLRVLTALVSNDPHREYGSGEKSTSYAPGPRKLENPSAEKHLEQVGGALPTWKSSGDERVTAIETHPAAASREWGRGSQPVFVENAGMVLAGPYLPMLFRKLDLLDKKKFKSRYAAEKAVHILEYMVTGEQSAPEYRLVLNKLLCGTEADRPIHQLFMLEKAETDLIRELILSMIAHWKALGKTSVEGFRQSFLTREGRLEANEDAWNLVVAPKPFDMLLDRIPWTFSPIRLPWMDRGLHVLWR